MIPIVCGLGVLCIWHAFLGLLPGECFVVLVVLVSFGVAFG